MRLPVIFPYVPSAALFQSDISASNLPKASSPEITTDAG